MAILALVRTKAITQLSAGMNPCREGRGTQPVGGLAVDFGGEIWAQSQLECFDFPITYSCVQISYAKKSDSHTLAASTGAEIVACDKRHKLSRGVRIE